VLVTLKGFGSIWERRLGTEPESGVRFGSRTFFNTTGVPVNGRVRHRWKIGGKIRFNARGGLNPNYPARSLNRVFQCDEPKLQATGWTQTFVRHLLPAPERPDYFLFAITAEQTGRLEWRSTFWKADEVIVVSFSEDGDQQETMLLMPAYSWIRGELGTFFVEPSFVNFWSAQLRLGRAA
jgi:hypothetical protein